ncbi:WD40 repeat protein [Chitinophaga niastensis]|uniref:WD40 repeat protein n=1 Tax=Chitinophaga niastensis TaxID=536980 RepID=A0A2P8HA22_CHINA|nr:OmpA family protein [Chitinophaga niastensis]PSL43077.1 WD40 repeat protein [Chitinophaga niastensis]
MYIGFTYRIIRCCTILLLAVCSSLHVHAQEQKELLQLAAEAYARQEYATANIFYNKVAAVKNGKGITAALQERLAKCNQETGHFNEAAYWYREWLKQPGCPSAANYGYGAVLCNLERYDSARTQFQQFITFNADSIRLKQLALQSCDSAIIWKSDTDNLPFFNMESLNTAASDWVCSIKNEDIILVSNGRRRMLFAGKKELHPAIDNRTEEPFYKPYQYSAYKSGDKTFFEGNACYPELLDKYHYHIGPVAANMAGDTLYLTMNVQEGTIRHDPVNGVRRLKLYWSAKRNGVWSKPVMIPGVDQDGFSSGHAALSHDGNTLYFVSDKPGGLGQTDIWYSEKQPDGNWGTPKNCGEGINTAAAENFPVINEDGLLYFSSKGRVGMGGYDIYIASGNKDHWGSPFHLPPPFNSGADDFGMVLKSSGIEGYLSSNRPEGCGSDDIYYFMDILHFKRYKQVLPDLKPIPVRTPGQRKGTNIAVSVPLKPAAPLQLTKEEQADICQLESFNFYFKYNSASLETGSVAMLAQVEDIMKRHPGWKLFIIAATDCRGTDTYNIDLSALRCFTLLDYLRKGGIIPGRLYYQNIGKKGIVNGCIAGVPCTGAQHRENRRACLKVIYR